MNNKIMFSIIVPIYNIENYLNQCVNSIINQTYKNFQLILVDDGSTDNSAILCDEWAKKDDRITVIHKKNEGLSAARNTGILNSKGLYLMFIDGDDFLYSNDNLYKINDFILNNKVDIVQYKMVYFFDDYKYKEQKDIIDINKISNIYASLRLLNRNGNISVSACDKVVKRDLIIKNNLLFEVGLLSEDIKWSYNLYLKANSLKIINYPIYVYRQQRIGSITTKKSVKHMYDMFDTIKYWISYKYNDKELQNLYFNMISYWYIIFRTIFSEKNYNNEMKEFVKKNDKIIFNYNENFKVNKAYRSKKIFGTKITILLMKLYTFLKNKGIYKI